MAWQEQVMNQALKWLLPIAAFLIIAGLARAQFNMAGAERDAIHEEGIAEGYRRQRAISEPVRAAEMERYAEQVVITHTLRDSVDATNERMAVAQMEAGRWADSLVARVAEVAGDSVATIAWADSLVVAHREEVRAVETRLAVAMQMNAALFRRIDTADLLLESHLAANELIRLELEAWKSTAEQWQRAARPSFLLKLKNSLDVAGVAIIVGAIGWEAIR